MNPPPYDSGGQRPPEFAGTRSGIAQTGGKIRRPLQVALHGGQGPENPLSSSRHAIVLSASIQRGRGLMRTGGAEVFWLNIRWDDNYKKAAP